MKSPSTMSSGLWIAVVTAIAIDLTMARIIDLTHDHNNETIMNGGSPKYTSTLMFKGDYVPGVFVELRSYSIGEHGGTHLDAPNHFFEGGRSLSEIPIEDTILEGVMVDCAEEAANDMMFKVTVKKLTDWEKVYGRIPDRAGVIFNFNRSSRFTDPKSYFETDTLNDTSTYKFPYVSEEAGEWMASKRNVKAIATDTATPDLFTGTFPVHRRFVLDNRLILEHLKDPGLLPPRNFRFHFSPVKFVGATGVQVRAYAMTYDPQNHGTRIGGWSVSGFGLTVVLVLTRLVITITV